MNFGKHVLDIDPAAESERIGSRLRHTVGQVMRRRGGVVGISGGVDSAVVLALCVRAFGPQRVVAILMPEKDSDPETEASSLQVAQHYGVEPVLEDITPVLEGFGCYQRRDEAIQRVFPEYEAAAGY
jgi:NAD+ synthase